MHQQMKPGFSAAVAVAALLMLSACDRQASTAAPDAPGGGKTASATASANDPILSAAEPFEALTEQAFTGDWASLDKVIADAGKAAAGAPVPAARAALLERRMKAIAQARAASDRVSLALAAVEGYRELVESQDRAAAQGSIAISLLDYAGFRYDALAQSPSVDWQEMARSVEFARGQWDALAPSIPSKPLAGVMSQALDGMARAVEQKDVAFARSAAATELALVDLLEERASSGL